MFDLSGTRFPQPEAPDSEHIEESFDEEQSQAVEINLRRRRNATELDRCDAPGRLGSPFPGSQSMCIWGLFSISQLQLTIFD
jgi:hypothetical protein